MEQPLPQKESTVLQRAAHVNQEQRIIRLEELRKEGLSRADMMVSGKGADYGHWSKYPEVVLASLMFVKAKRALELAMQRASVQNHQPKNEPFEDTALDGVNYCSFMYAAAVGKKEGLL